MKKNSPADLEAGLKRLEDLGMYESLLWQDMKISTLIVNTPQGYILSPPGRIVIKEKDQQILLFQGTVFPTLDDVAAFFKETLNESEGT